MPIQILGIETTCDDTSLSLVRDGKEVLSLYTASQYELHERFGGVVPEIASRAHLESIFNLLEKLKISPDSIDGIAVSNRPGLLGSLLVGLSVARGLAYGWDKPLLAVNHIHAHFYAAHLETNSPPVYPYLGLVISGGHTALYICRSATDLTMIASTLDDAAGEAFDKGASLLGLPQPGGPAIDKAAKKTKDWKSLYEKLPDIRPKRDSLDPSFSGIKTALLYYLQGTSQGKLKERRIPEKEEQENLSAAYQERIIDALIAMATRGLEKEKLNRLVIAGGVAGNTRLRELFEMASNGLDKRGRIRCQPFELHFPKFRYCMDNGAMVAGLGYHLFLKKDFAPLDIAADPTPLRMNL